MPGHWLCCCRAGPSSVGPSAAPCSWQAEAGCAPPQSLAGAPGHHPRGGIFRRSWSRLCPAWTRLQERVPSVPSVGNSRWGRAQQQGTRVGCAGAGCRLLGTGGPAPPVARTHRAETCPFNAVLMPPAPLRSARIAATLPHRLL